MQVSITIATLLQSPRYEYKVETLVAALPHFFLTFLFYEAESRFSAFPVA